MYRSSHFPMFRRVFLALVLAVQALSLSPSGISLAGNYCQLSVHIKENAVAGFDCPMATYATVTVDDPATPLSPDYTGQAGVFGADWGQYYYLSLGDTFMLKPNQLVTLTVGTVTRSIRIVPFEVTRVDRDADTVSGKTIPNGSVGVDIGPNWAKSRSATADAEGNWTVNFQLPLNDAFDITAETDGQAYYIDDDGDTVQVLWDAHYKSFIPVVNKQ